MRDSRVWADGLGGHPGGWRAFQRTSRAFVVAKRGGLQVCQRRNWSWAKTGGVAKREGPEERGARRAPLRLAEQALYDFLLSRCWIELCFRMQCLPGMIAVAPTRHHSEPTTWPWIGCATGVYKHHLAQGKVKSRCRPTGAGIPQAVYAYIFACDYHQR